MVRSSIFHVLGVLLLVGCAALIGCSDNSSVAPSATTASGDQFGDRNTNASGDVGTGETVGIDAMITRVDLTNSSLALSSRSESVIFDENTIAYRIQKVERSGNSGSMGANEDFIRIPLVLSDLSLGDTIRISAEVMNETTIKAIEIELAGEFHDPWFDIQFTDRLATIDTTTFEVTFENNPFGGVVFICAQLQDPDGNWLWLRDFNPGELVDVKGHTIEGGVFEILVMIKVAD